MNDFLLKSSSNRATPLGIWAARYKAKKHAKPPCWASGNVARVKLHPAVKRQHYDSMTVQRNNTTNNNNEKSNLLNSARLPARLLASQTAAVLGFADENIAVLVKARLLLPLGKPAKNAVKFFAANEVLKLAEDHAWLGKATSVIYRHCQEQNDRRRSKPEDAELDVLVTAE